MLGHPPGNASAGVSPSGPKVLCAEPPLPSFQVSRLRIVLSMVMVVWWQRRDFSISRSVSILPGEKSGSRNPEGGSFLQPGSPPWLVTSAGNGKQRPGVRARRGDLVVRQAASPSWQPESLQQRGPVSGSPGAMERASPCLRRPPRPELLSEQ